MGTTFGGCDLEVVQLEPLLVLMTLEYSFLLRMLGTWLISLLVPVLDGLRRLLSSIAMWIRWPLVVKLRLSLTQGHVARGVLPTGMSCILHYWDRASTWRAFGVSAWPYYPSHPHQGKQDFAWWQNVWHVYAPMMSTSIRTMSTLIMLCSLQGSVMTFDSWALQHYRTRWRFGIWLRHDIAGDTLTIPKLVADRIELWTSQKYQFKLPKTLQDELVLDGHVCGDSRLLPTKRRGLLDRKQDIIKCFSEEFRSLCLLRKPTSIECIALAVERIVHLPLSQTALLGVLLAIHLQLADGMLRLTSRTTFHIICFQDDWECCHCAPGHAFACCCFQGDSQDWPRSSQCCAALLESQAYCRWCGGAAGCLRADRVQLLRNKSCERCAALLKNLNPLLVAAHALHFHQDVPLRYLPTTFHSRWFFRRPLSLSICRSSFI